MKNYKIRHLTLYRAEILLNNLTQFPPALFWRWRLKQYYCHIICESVFHMGYTINELLELKVEWWLLNKSRFTKRIQEIMAIYLKEIHLGGELLFLLPYSEASIKSYISRRLKCYGTNVEELRLVGLNKVIQGF